MWYILNEVDAIAKGQNVFRLPIKIVFIFISSNAMRLD